LNGFKWFLNGE